MSDTKELIEMAAKALQYGVSPFLKTCDDGIYTFDAEYWNLHTSQADNDRMACDLFISTRITPVEAYAVNALVGKVVDACVAHDGTIEGCRAAVREARTQVAAQLGKLKGTS